MKGGLPRACACACCPANGRQLPLRWQTSVRSSNSAACTFLGAADTGLLLLGPLWAIDPLNCDLKLVANQAILRSSGRDHQSGFPPTFFCPLHPNLKKKTCKLLLLLVHVHASLWLSSAPSPFLSLAVDPSTKTMTAISSSCPGRERSVLRNGSPPYLLETRRRLSRTSLNSSSPAGLGCATF
jgi:hypothetical protein